MDKVQNSFKIEGSKIEITLDEGVRDNSIYEIRIKKIESAHWKRELNDFNLKIFTKITPSYTSIESVKALIDDEVSDDRILYNIREASRYAEYIKKEVYKSDLNIPFEVTQYVRYKAAYDSLLYFYIQRSSSMGEKGTLGEISFEHSTSSSHKNLLDQLKDEVDYWELHLRGFGFEGRAKPQSAVKSSRTDLNTSLILASRHEAKYGTKFNNISRGIKTRWNFLNGKFQ